MSPADPIDPLTFLRLQVDQLDDQIVDLLNDRARLAVEIREAKRRAGLPIHSPQREKEILDRVCRRSAGPLAGDSVLTIFRAIISATSANG